MTSILFPHNLASRKFWANRWPFILPPASALIFGLWFKLHQLHSVSPKLWEYYPVSFYLVFELQIVIIFLALWGLLAFCMRMAYPEDSAMDLIKKSAFPFAGYLLALFNTSLGTQVFWAGIIFLGIFAAGVRANQRQKFLEPIGILLYLLVLFLVVFQPYSPLFNENFFFDTWHRNDYWLGWISQWENAKGYEFIGRFSQESLLGSYPVFDYNSASEFSALLMLILDIPAVSWIATGEMIKFLQFGLFVFSSFGLYCYLRFGEELSLLPAMLGGTLCILGNSALLALTGNEHLVHFSEIFFLPWSLWAIRHAYRVRQPSFIFLGGLIQTLTEYVFCSYPPVKIVALGILCIFNLFLALEFVAPKEGWLKCAGHVFLLPLATGFGWALRIFPYLEAVRNKEYLLTQPHAQMGFLWPGFLESITSIFFSQGTFAVNAQYSLIVGQFVPLFYFGHLILLLILFLIFKMGRFKQEKVPVGTMAFFYLTLTLFLLLNAWGGDLSPLSLLLNQLNLGNYSQFPRLAVFLFFLATITGMFGMHLLMKEESSNILWRAFLTCVALMVGLGAFKVQNNPDFDKGLMRDIPMLLSAFLALMALHFFRGKRWVAQLLVLGMGWLTLYSLGSAVYLKKNEYGQNHRRKPFVSFTTQALQFKKIQHDTASREFLKERIRQFVRDETYFQEFFRIVNNAPHLREYLFDLNFAMKFKRVRISIPDIEEIVQTNIEALEKSLNSLPSEKRFMAVAEKIDTFYRGNQFFISINDPAVPLNLSALATHANSAALNVLPEGFHLVAPALGSTPPPIIPLGKFFDLNALGPYRNFGNFPEEKSYYYLYDLIGENPHVAFQVDRAYNPQARTIMDVIGVDFIIYDSDNTPDFDVEKSGLEVFNKIQTNGRNFVLLKNPRSFGLAYMAKKAIPIPPYDLDSSREYHKYMSFNIFRPFVSRFRNGAEFRTAFLEHPDPKKENELQYRGDNSVSIQKVLGSKVLFEAECRDPECLLVYNLGDLKGWRAYAEGSPLKISRTNFAFMGITVPAGHHDVWMEYRPASLTVGLLTTFLGWMLCFGWVLFTERFRTSPIDTPSET